MEEKWDRRDRKLRKRRSLDMVVSGRSTKTVLLQVIGKKAKEKRSEHREDQPV
jgi:hypothetical protein